MIKEKVKKFEVNKITPLHDLSWYVKWISSVLILTAVCFRAAGGFHMFDLYFSFAGTIGWLWVGILWHDRALMVVNSIAVFIYLMGLLGATF